MILMKIKEFYCQGEWPKEAGRLGHREVSFRDP